MDDVGASNLLPASLFKCTLGVHVVITMTESQDADANSVDKSDQSDGRNTSADAETDIRHAVILDHLPHGRADNNRPRHQRDPLAYGLGERDFRLYELTLDADADIDISIGDRVVVGPTEARELVDEFRQISYADLSNTAQNEVEYAVEDIIKTNERRFVDFYNDAQPITLRLHQLNLLPGIGKKLRNNILDQRKRGPFESFDEIEERVAGLHHPSSVLKDRILEELHEDDLKYNVFVAPSE